MPSVHTCTDQPDYCRDRRSEGLITCGRPEIIMSSDQLNPSAVI